MILKSSNHEYESVETVIHNACKHKLCSNLKTIVKTVAAVLGRVFLSFPYTCPTGPLSDLLG